MYSLCFLFERKSEFSNVNLSKIDLKFISKLPYEMALNKPGNYTLGIRFLERLICQFDGNMFFPRNIVRLCRKFIPSFLGKVTCISTISQLNISELTKK